MNIWGRALKLFGWKISISVPRRNKCVICVAPHTSNWDFILALSAYKSLGREANFLMKEFWFFFPLGYIFRKLGGIAVPKIKGSDLTTQIIKMFNNRNYINLAITPEGTRSLNKKWRKGFLYIAYDAKVPIQLGVIDYASKNLMIHDEFIPTGNIESDMQFVKDYYSKFTKAAKYPEKFSTDNE